MHRAIQLQITAGVSSNVIIFQPISAIDESDTIIVVMYGVGLADVNQFLR